MRLRSSCASVPFFTRNSSTARRKPSASNACGTGGRATKRPSGRNAPSAASTCKCGLKLKKSTRASPSHASNATPGGAVSSSSLNAHDWVHSARASTVHDRRSLKKLLHHRLPSTTDRGQGLRQRQARRRTPSSPRRFARYRASRLRASRRCTGFPRAAAADALGNRAIVRALVGIRCRRGRARERPFSPRRIPSIETTRAVRP